LSGKKKEYWGKKSRQKENIIIDHIGAEMIENRRKEIEEEQNLAQKPLITQMRRSRQSQYSILNSFILKSFTTQSTKPLNF